MADPAALISRKTGDWWKDDRRNHCAYCGVDVVPIKGPVKTSTSMTRDHIIPRAHTGKHVTIPCCNACNVKKGNVGLPEFMLTQYFSDIRAKKHPHQWSLRDLWLVMAMASVEQARSAHAWPAEKTVAAPKNSASAKPKTGAANSTAKPG